MTLPCKGAGARLVTQDPRLRSCLCAGIAHLMGSRNKEAEAAGEPVRVHCLSPGMVLTDLLLAGATDRNKQARTCPMHALTLQAV